MTNNYATDINFEKELLDCIKSCMPQGCSVETADTPKGKAFHIHEKGTTAAPIFYFSDCYRMYENGRELGDIARRVLDVYFQKGYEDVVAGFDFLDFDAMERRIAFKFVNTEEYGPFIAKVPHTSFYDLSAICYCIVDLNEEGCTSFVVTNDIMDKWGIDEATLFEMAGKYTPDLMPLKIASVFELLNGEGSIPTTDLEETINHLPAGDLYTITNVYGQNGFGAIFYQGVMDAIANRFGSFYIIPSSIHEAIFIPASMQMPPEDILKMIAEVNATEVGPEDFLSGSLYMYNHETRQIEVFTN